MAHLRMPQMITDGVITVPNICGGSDAATHAATNVQTDPASGFPEARPGESQHPTQQHHSAQQPRNEQGQFTQEEINARVEAARSEERDKLYERLEKAKGGDNDEAIAGLQTQVEEIKQMFAQQQEFFQQFKPAEQNPAEQKPAGTEMKPAGGDAPDVDAITKQFEQQMRELQGQVSTVQQERDAERALREREAELAELESYRQTLIADNQEDVAPELLGFVKGYSREDIDASLEAAKQASGKIMDAFRQAQEEQQQTTVGQRAAMPTVGTNAPGSMSAPLDQTQQPRELTAAEIKAMPMAEFARLRPQLIRPNRGQGMFG